MRLNWVLGAGIVLALVGASLLVSFGLLYLRPHLDVRHLLEGVCQVTAIMYTDDVVQCTCASDGSSCVSQYPCLRITVVISHNGEIVSNNATLYDSYETYMLQSSALQCSYHRCGRSVSDNVDAVKSFASQFEQINVTKPSRCYYDPSHTDYTLLEIVGISTAVNAVVWPVLATVVGLAIFFFQIFHADAERWNQKTSRQFGSLERQWARIRERHYGRMTSGCAERLVSTDANATETALNQNSDCLIH